MSAALSQRSIGVQGMGFGARQIALQGLWPVSALDSGLRFSQVAAGRKADDDDVLLISKAFFDRVVKP